jgi:hypothetical protein
MQGPAKRTRSRRRQAGLNVSASRLNSGHGNTVHLSWAPKGPALACWVAAHGFRKGRRRPIAVLGLEPLGGSTVGRNGVANRVSNAGDSGRLACELSSTRESLRGRGMWIAGVIRPPALTQSRPAIQPEARFSSTFLHALPAQARRARRGRDQKRETPGCS